MSMLRKLIRRKYVDTDETRTELHRVLTTFDLVLLGIGSTLGTGIYILAGEVAYRTAGPSVVLSFLVAAFASVLAGLCYAEFGARVPKAGSAYVYSYVCVGEVIAFIVGWTLIMEYIIGVASVSKAYSNTVDNMIPDHAMSAAFKDVGTISVSFLGEYFDFFAFGIAGVLTILLMFGVKESSIFNNVCTVLNLLVVIFAVIAGGIYSSTDFWRIDPANLTECKNISGHGSVEQGDVGSGGFFPFGVTGMLAGAATCFYGFIGFDVLATTGEEAKNPKKSIPMSIVISLFFIFLAYFGISTVMTMMLPYYCQDPSAPLPFAFEYNGFNAGKWIVNIGALFGLSTSLMGSMFPMPRIIYAMAQDGLLFKFLGKVHPKFQTPIWATLIGGFIGALMGALFKLNALIEMMSVGTLTAYTIVAVCVLMLRYRKDEGGYFDETSSAEALATKTTREGLISRLFNAKNAREPTRGSGRLTTWVVVGFCIFCFGFCATLILGEGGETSSAVGETESGRAKRAVVESTEAFPPLAIAFLVFFGLLMLLCLLSLSRQAVSRTKLSFKVPLLPWIPALSILINIYLILKLSWPTWVRFGIWLAIGLVIYLYCLGSGRADRVYDDNYTQFQTLNRKKGKKISFPGIDNQGMDFRDEGEKDMERKNGGFVGEYEIKPSHKNGKGGNGGLSENHHSRKVGNTPEAVNPIVKIHELNQKSLNGEVIQMEELVLAPKDEGKRSGGGEFHVKSQAPKPAPRVAVTPKVMLAPPVVEEIPREVLVLHEKAQESLNEMEKVRLETPEDVVDGVVAEAETAASIIDAGYSKKAQELVDDAFRMALENIDEPPVVALSGSDVEPDPVPPFVSKAKELNEFQKMQLNSTNSSPREKRVLIDPKSVPNPMEYIHQVCQAEMDGSAGAGLGLILVDKPKESVKEDDGLAKISVERAGQNVSQEPPVLPKGFVSKVFITHEAAKDMMKAEDSIEEIHQIYQEAINGIGESDAKQPILVSPGLREEAKKAIQDYVSDVQNHNVPEGEGSGGPVLVVPGMVEEILKIHEVAKEELQEPDPMDTIHEICKRVLEDIEEALQNHPLLLNSRSQREEAKEVARAAVEAGVVEGDKNEEETPVVSIQSPEDVALMMISHAKAQEEFEDLRSAESEEKYNVNTMHDIAQLSMNGVSAESVPWLKPVVSTEEEKQEVTMLTRSLLEVAQEGASASEPDPLPPHVVRKMEEDLQRAHLLAQEALRESAEEKSVQSLESQTSDATTSIHAIAQLCLDGVNIDSVTWLDPVLSTSEDKKSIQKLTQSLAEEAVRNSPPVEPIDVNETVGPDSASGIAQYLVDIHRRAQETLNGESPKPEVPVVPSEPENEIEIIHKVAQLALDGVPVDTVPWLTPITSSDEQREEIKETTKRLVEKAITSQPKPPASTPVSENVPTEIPEGIIDIHNGAQEKLNERYVTAPQTPIDEPATSIIEQIHQMAQLRMAGVESVPWLSPVVSSEESKAEIRDLNSRLTAEFESTSSNSDNAPETPAADKLNGSFANQIKKIHDVAQKTLEPVKKPVTFAERFPQFEDPEESEGEFVTVGSVLSDLPSLVQESPEIPQLPNSPSPASSEGSEGKRFRIETKVFLSPTTETPAVKFDDSPSYLEPADIEPITTNDRDSIRRRIMNRRPTGPALPGLKKFHAKLSGSTAEESEEEDEEEEEDQEEDEQDDEVASSSSNQSLELDDRKATELEPQPAVPRRQSNNQLKSQSMKDLISMFEQGKSS